MNGNNKLHGRKGVQRCWHIGIEPGDGGETVQCPSPVRSVVAREVTSGAGFVAQLASKQEVAAGGWAAVGAKCSKGTWWTGRVVRGRHEVGHRRQEARWEVGAAR